MMRKIIFILILLIPLSVKAAGDAVQVQLNVEGCNNNSMCEAVIGEDVVSCPNDCTPPPTTSGGRTYGSIPRGKNFFQNLNIKPEADKVVITWYSDVPTLSTIRWGLSQEFKDGSIASTEFIKDHTVELIGLVPGTFYYFTVDSRDAYGGKVSLPYQMFFTRPLPDTIAPQNPQSFRVISEEKGIRLRWTNPSDIDFSSVRIMKSESRFPASPFSGTLVYEGKGTSTLDRNVSSGSTYRYAIFSKDRNGNYSSGAITTGMYVKGQVTPPVVFEPEPVQEPIPEPATPAPTPVPAYPSIEEIPFGRFKVTEGNGILVSISSTELPVGISDLWINVLKQDRTISGQFLFTYNPKDGNYTAEIPSIDPGNYPVVIMGYMGDATIRISSGILAVYNPVTTVAPSLENTRLDVTIGLLLLCLVTLLLILKRYIFRKL